MNPYRGRDCVAELAGLTTEAFGWCRVDDLPIPVS
jgi:hypothetical protein